MVNENGRENVLFANIDHINKLLKPENKQNFQAGLSLIKLVNIGIKLQNYQTACHIFIFK